HCEKALSVYRQEFGEQHPSTAASYTHLAHILGAQGMYAEGHLHYEKALAINRELLSEQHLATANSYSRLAQDLANRGKTHEAITHWQAAATISEVTRLPTATSGFERSLFERDALSPHAALAVSFASLHEPVRAWEYAEAYLARGLLDDLDPTSRH